MSNPWAQSFEELRSPYLQEKKAKKDYDGDGKIESGTDEYMGSKDKAIKKAMAMRGKKKVAEHHQKDKDGNTIPHEDGTPSSVEEEKKFGPGGDPIKKPGFLDKALNKLKNNTPVKKVDKAHYEPEGEAIDEMITLTKGDYGSRNSPGSAYSVAKSKKFDPKIYKAGGGLGANFLPLANSHEPEGEVIEAKIDKIDPKNKRNRRNVAKFGKQTKPYDPPTKEMKTSMGKFMQKTRQDMHKSKRGVKKEEVVLESDKKGKGSGTKDACYHKVKSRYSVWPSAYASGALVKCRKVGAKNWGNSSKKEEFDYYQMPMKSFGDMVGECWKTHKKVGMKMKGGKMVPDCRPKNESVEEAVKSPKLDVKETGVKNKIEINPEIKTEAAKAPVKK